MVKASKAFAEKMRKRKQSMARKGVVIDKKDWTKGRIRLLPANGEDPAREFLSYWNNEKKKSVTAPRTFGVVDPLWDRLESIYKTGEKAEKEHAKDYISRSTEYWVGCIVRGDEGTASNPNVRVFRLPQGVYQYIVDLIIDEDYGEDVTHEDEGRDILIKKEGKGVKTEWKPDKMDQCPIVEDEELYERLVEIAETFDPASHFFRFDLDDYRETYEGLTGEELPEDCIDELEALAEGQAPEDSDEEEEDEEGEDEEGEDEEYDEEEEEGDDEEEEEDDGEDEESEEEEDEEEDLLADPPEGIEFGKTVVSFKTEDGDAEGVVQSWAEDPDDEENYVLAIVGEDDDPDDPWLIDPDEVEIVEEEDEGDGEEEEEAEEAEPTVRRGKKTGSKMPRRPKSGAAKEIRSGKKKTTKKATSKATSKKTTKKASTRKASTSKATSKKTTKKASTRKPAASKKKTSKKTTKKASSRKSSTRKKSGR